MKMKSPFMRIVLSSIFLARLISGETSIPVQAVQQQANLSTKSWSTTLSRGGSENANSNSSSGVDLDVDGNGDIPTAVMNIEPNGGVSIQSVEEDDAKETESTTTTESSGASSSSDNSSLVEDSSSTESSESSETIQNDTTSVEASEIDEISLVFTPSKHGDGSENDPDGIPTRYISMQKGNREKAKLAFASTVQWREEHSINSILSKPHPTFDTCKRIFPVYIPGRDVSNNIIVIQRVGMIDLELGSTNDITGDDLLMHYVYMIEYCWNILEPSPTAVMTSVLDLKNVRLQTFRQANIREFLKKFVKTMSDHYPQRSYKTLIINAPSWVNMAYNLVKPILRESTKKKITLLNGGKKQDKALIEILGKDNVPRDLLNDPGAFMGSSSGVDGGVESSSEIEIEMREFCQKQLKKNNIEMQEIIEVN